jgi:antitoxin component YwqK of YwqJK toxin-antitoxin module
MSCSNYRYVTQNYNATIIIDSVQAAKIDTDYEIEKDSNDIHIVQTYSKDSILISIERYIDYKNSIHTDESRFWYRDGNLKKIINYNKDGKKERKLITYHNNGQIKRDDSYKMDLLISGKCYDSLGNEVQYFPYETDPIVDMKQFSNCLKYPENLRR